MGRWSPGRGSSGVAPLRPGTDNRSIAILARTTYQRIKVRVRHRGP